MDNEPSTKMRMDPSYIAALDLVAVHPGGVRVPVSLRVGAPKRVSRGEWSCAVRLDGLHDGLTTTRGEDSVQALCLALGLAATLLRDFVSRGGRLVHAEATEDGGSESDWPLEAYFRGLAMPESPAT
ncbi:MAG TPA: hypothetical protein VHN20_03605 [Beijerinckiaceae bacterium]|nr:hypothetical protein [Beijerinckiaceae bacterium]